MTTRTVMVAIAGMLLTTMAGALSQKVVFHKISKEGVGKKIGSVQLKDAREGLLLKPSLQDLPPGPHGFHVHQNPDCSPAKKNGNMIAGAAAGGHYDPGHTGKHKGPYKQSGHAGDLPVLMVNGKGQATTPTLAPHLAVSQVRGHAIIIHQGSDNYSDHPEPLGGGGARIACGIVPQAGEKASS